MMKTSGKPWLAIRRGFRAIAEHRERSVILVGLVALVVSGALSWLRHPVPRVHDEFSNLLAADTFAHGRLANPTHRLWPFFESMHVIQTPTYATKYPPVPGLFLAVGAGLSGKAIVGAWLSVALGCAAVCWMLQGWTRPSWAVLGGLLAALHHGIHGGVPGWGMSYSWSQSFWGGGPGMLGGALVAGALPRILALARPIHGVALGSGLMILANTRPFEGLIVSVPIVVAIAWKLARSKEMAWAILPAALVVLMPGFLAMLAYNRAITGSALSLPYSVHEAQYNPAPIFANVARPRTPPSYRHEVLERFYTSVCMDQVERQRTWRGWLAYHGERLDWMQAFYVGPLALPLLMLPWVLRQPRNRFALASCVSLVVAHLFTVGIQPHYAAPAACFFFLLVVEGMRHLYVLRVGRLRPGPLIVLGVALLVAIDLGVVANALAHRPEGWAEARAGLDADLEAAQGKHLVIVRYGPGHDTLHEWVYNKADIDGARVVWAREMSAPEMKRLLEYFRDRTIWRIEPDQNPTKLIFVRPSQWDRKSIAGAFRR
jgi:hypothetical protein